MATASTKSKKKIADRKKPSSEIEEIDEYRKSLCKFMRIANVHGIKEIEIWADPNRYGFTYFLLPTAPVRLPLLLHAAIDQGRKIDVEDFVRFWRRLSDSFKERLFLVDYLCSIRVFVEKPCEFAEPRQREVRDILIDLMGDLFSEFRRRFIDDQKKIGAGGFFDMVKGLINAFFPPQDFDDRQVKVMDDIFTIGFRKALVRGEPVGEILRSRSIIAMIVGVSTDILTNTIFDFVSSYLGWASLNTCNAQRYLQGMTVLFDMMPAPVAHYVNEKMQKKYMKKFRVAVPHWRVEDRALILKAIDTKGESCRGSYVETLIKKVGVDRFKILALGKEKFCATCGRSSYIGKDRLWCCKRCCEEGVRPKARYCNVTCQKADWRKHKSEKHARKKAPAKPTMIGAGFWGSSMELKMF